MRVNGDAIHGTTASPFTGLPWGRCTTKTRPDGATLYLHVFDWPADKRLRAPGLKTPVARAYLMSNPKASLSTESQPDGVTVLLPAQAPDPISSTVVLELKGAIKIEP